MPRATDSHTLVIPYPPHSGGYTNAMLPSSSTLCLQSTMYGRWYCRFTFKKFVGVIHQPLRRDQYGHAGDQPVYSSCCHKCFKAKQNHGTNHTIRVKILPTLSASQHLTLQFSVFPPEWHQRWSRLKYRYSSAQWPQTFDCTLWKWI